MAARTCSKVAAICAPSNCADGNDAHCNEGGDQAVLNGGGAGLVFNETLHDVLHMTQLPLVLGADRLQGRSYRIDVSGPLTGSI